MKTQKIKIKVVQLGDEGCHIFCTARINGQKARVLIDTGASKSVLSTEFASSIKKLKYIKPSEENQTSGIGPGVVDTRFARLKKVEFKNLTVKNLIVGTIDVSHVKKLYKSLNVKPFDFILGGEVLEMHNAKIDYKLKIMSLG